MGDLSEHFNRKEFACPCGCGYDTVDAELVRVLENMRDMLRGKPVKINSGCRCIRHNAKVGGVESSLHRHGKAADIVVKGLDADIVADCLDELYPDKYGIGRYPSWVHIDVRPEKARWSKR